MKKLLAFLLCVLMSVSMLGLMTACDGNDESDGKTVSESDDKNSTDGTSKDNTAGKSDEELIIGKWEADVKFNDELLSTVSGGDEDVDMSEMMQYFDFDKLSLKMSMEFKNDGTATVTIDDDDLNTFLENLVDVMCDGSIKLTKEMLKDSDTTWEDYLDSIEMTEAEFVNELREELEKEGLEEVKAEIKENMTDGYYKLENGKLYMSDSKDFEEDDASEYNLTDKTLTFEQDGIKLTFNKK